MYERLLIPTDGSENVAKAVEHGITMAEQYGASIHALSVVPYVVTRDRLRYDPNTTAERAVEDIKRKCREMDLDITTAIRKGEPAQEILAYSRENDIDVIVMGTHGRTGLAHTVIGSVAERVVRRSSVPVMTVRPED